MFVKRKPSRVPPGRRNKQIYVPHKQMQIVTPPLEIRTKADALFYYNELKRLGYIPDPPVPLPNNAIVAMLGSSDNTFVEFAVDNDNIIFSGQPLEGDAIEPPPVPEQEYDIQLLGTTVAYMATIDGTAKPYWLCTGTYGNNNDITFNTYTNNSTNVLMNSVDQVLYYDIAIGGNNVKIAIFSDRLGDVMWIFRCDQWRIDLSPAQTLLKILMIPVNQ